LNQFGWLSDHSTLKLGRRLPFMLLGGPLLGLTFGSLFFPPDPTHQSASNTVYFCVLFALFNILNAFTCSPYAALLPELTPNKRERIHLATFSGLFALLGNLFAATVGPVQYALSGGFSFLGIHLDSGLQLMALLATLFHVLGFWLPLCFLRERSRAPRKHSNLFKAGFFTFYLFSLSISPS
jgi:Na+/melibiose symporter-like transporter